MINIMNHLLLLVKILSITWAKLVRSIHSKFIAVSVFLLNTHVFFHTRINFVAVVKYLCWMIQKGDEKAYLQAQTDNDVINYIRIDNNKIFWSRW